MKPEGCNPVEASGADITASQKPDEPHALGGNLDVSSTCSDWSVETRNNQTDSFILTTSKHDLRDLKNQHVDKSCSVTSDMSLVKSDLQFSDNLWMEKEVNAEVEVNSKDSPAGCPDEETGVRSMFDDPIDIDIWVPPSSETDDILDMLDDEDDEDGDDDNECVDVNSEPRSSPFKELKERKMEDVKTGKFRNLVSQLLNTLGIANLEKEGEGWADIVSSLAWEAALIVKPEEAEGKTMDPAAYVKVKCVASGSRDESKLVKGLVFTKHAAHKHMATKYTKPKLMLIQGMLGHSSGLSSFSSMIVQDKENVQKKDNIAEDVKNLLRFLKDCDPNVVLMEKLTPREVVEAIYKMGMILVDDMKLHRLERIARCTGSPIWSANSVKGQRLIQCDFLYFEKFIEENAQLGEGGKMPHKTLMFLEDSLNCLGCTVVLKGSNIEELKKIKCVVQCAVLMAYHYIMETSFLIDQDAMFSTVSSAGGACKQGRESSKVQALYDNLTSQSENKAAGQAAIEELDPSAKQYIKPYLPSDYGNPDSEAAYSVLPTKDEPGICREKPNGYLNDEKLNDIDNSSQLLLAKEEFVSDLQFNGSDSDDYNGRKDDISAVLDSESILVLMSCRNALRGTVCEQSHFSHIKFYRNFDVPLGMFLRDNVLNQSVLCKACGEQPESHFYYYAHNNKQLTIRVKQISGALFPGETAGKLWMWSRCGICKSNKEGGKNTTKLVLISRAARGLSFGKFLELGFSNYSSINRLSKCGHSLHRDFLYFFGLGSMVSMFRYSPVSKYTVAVPPQKLEFNSPIKGDWLQKEIEHVHTRATSFFTEVSGYLKKIETRFSGLTLNINGLIKEFIDIEKMLAAEEFEFEENIKKTCIQNGPSMRKLLCLNRLRWELFLEACIWNRRLQLLLSSGSDSAYITTISKVVPNKVNDAQYTNKTSEATTASLDHGLSQVVLDDNHDKDAKTSADVEVQIESVPGPDEHDMSRLIVSTNGSHLLHPTENTTFFDHVITQEKIPVFEEHNTSNAGGSFSSGKAPLRPALNLEISRGQWVWKSFVEIRKECMKDIRNRAHIPSFLDSFRFNLPHSPDFLPTVSQIINEEASRVHIPLCNDDYIVSNYEGEISSIIACAVAFMNDIPQPPMRADESTSLSRATSEPYPLSSLSSIAPESDKIHPAPSMSYMESQFLPSFDALNLWASLGNVHPVVPLGVGAYLGKEKYSVVCLYANEFRGLRNLCCPSELDYIASLSRCRIWDAKGGKSKALFAKTLDDRFIIKEIKRTEFESFTKFASDYFKYMKQSFESRNQTCLAKILGIYQVTVRQPKSGKETKHDLVVIEHLSYGRNYLARQYDLKGALHARYTASAHGSGDVLLDQNFVNDMNMSPLYVGKQAKRLLQRAVWNDTIFLHSINVMDYSLLVGVDLKQKELVCGIIDYLRQYTLDKQLETWVKSSLVVPKNLLPTIISPKEYKKRFRKFMDTHFLTVPDQWCSRRPNPCKLCGTQINHASST